MLRAANGSRATHWSRGGTHIVDLRHREKLRRRLSAVLGGGALFALAFLAAYLIAQDPKAPTTPLTTTWRGSAMTTLPETAPSLADPIAQGAPLPPLRVVSTTARAFEESSRSTHATVSPPPPQTTAASHEDAVTTQPARDFTRPKPTTTTSAPPKLITVTN